MRSHRNSATSTRMSEEGSVAVIAVVAAVALTASAALSVDVGTFFFAKRKQQSATDIAAVVAAGHIGQAQQAVLAQLGANGLDPNSLVSLEYGSYQADPLLPIMQRFQLSNAGTANAVRVTVRSVAPMYFGSAILSAVEAGASESPGVTIQSQATAAQANFAAIAIGSQLASLNGGLLNQVFGRLLGSSLSLSVMDYQALLSAQLDIVTFSNLLASRVGVRGITYGQLAATSVRPADLFSALADAIAVGGGSAAARAAFAQIASANIPTANTIKLGALIDFGPFAATTVGADAPIAASIMALDALTMVASIAGSGHLISLDLGATFPGLASTTLLLAVGEPPAHTSFVGLGRVGTQIHTAQTRLLVTIQVPALTPLLSLKLPVYLELASATATLSSLSCDPGADSPTASLAVQPSLGDIWIGQVSNGPMSDFSQSPTVQPAPIATALGLTGIYGRAHGAVSNTATKLVSFSATDIALHVKHKVTTTDFTTGLIESLSSSLQLSVSMTGSNPPPPLIAQAVPLQVKQVASSVDQALDSLLNVLGLELGNADTWVTGVRCGGGVLVN